MTPTSLITARWVKQNGVLHETELPNTNMIMAFCFSEFGQMCSESVAVRVRQALLALAKEWKGEF